MQIFLGVLIGMVMWQLITSIVALLSGENEEITAYVGCGMPLLIQWAIMRFILRPIRNAWVYRGRRSIIWNVNDKTKIYRCSPQRLDKLRTASGFEIEVVDYTDSLQEAFPLKDWSEKDKQNVMGKIYPKLRYAPKWVWQHLPEYPA